MSSTFMDFLELISRPKKQDFDVRLALVHYPSNFAHREILNVL